MCPIFDGDEMCAFIVPGPKQRDLHRDGRYALHSFPLEDNEDAFYLTGTVRYVADIASHRRVGEVFVQERSALGVPLPGEHEHLFAFAVATAMLTRTTGHGDPAPQHQIWRA